MTSCVTVYTEGVNVLQQVSQVQISLMVEKTVNRDPQLGAVAAPRRPRQRWWLINGDILALCRVHRNDRDGVSVPPPRACSCIGVQ